MLPDIYSKYAAAQSLSCIWLFATPWTVSTPGSLVHVIFQERILEWVAISFSRGSSRPGDQTQVSCTAGRFFTIWATRWASEHIKYFSLEFYRIYQRKWQSTLVLLPGKSHGWRSLVGYSPWGCKKLGMTEWLLLLSNIKPQTPSSGIIFRFWLW